MSVKSIVKAVDLTTFNSASLNNNYQLVNANGLGFPCFLLRINNGGTTDITVSYDGVTAHEYVVTKTTSEINTQTNSQPQNNMAFFPKGMKVYVKGTAGVGTIAVSAYYQPQGL